MVARHRPRSIVGAGSASGDPPFFVVGSPRSGTTLLRWMLDGHPRIAVPPESHFIVGPRRRRRGRRPRSVKAVVRHEMVLRWSVEVDLDELRRRAERRSPRTYAEMIAAVYQAFAGIRGKDRWGDKTPHYVRSIAELDQLFPDARFVHVIRDGREAAASIAETDWGPSSAVEAAFLWRTSVRAGVSAGRRLGPDRYTQLRLEDLVEDPEGELRRLCGFLGEDYAPAMLDYPKRFDPSAPWTLDHPHLSKPPTSGLRDWRTGQPRHLQLAIDAVCVPLLDELGYAPEKRRVAPLPYAWWVRGFEAAAAAPLTVRRAVTRRRARLGRRMGRLVGSGRSDAPHLSSRPCGRTR